MKRESHFKVISLSAALMLVLVMAGLLTIPAGAQIRTMKLEGDVFMLKELGAVISEDESGLKALMVMPPDQRHKDYREVDLREGDMIMMMNGKRMKTAAQMEEAYAAMAIGDVIKLGLKRDKEMLMATLSKANPDDLPGQMKIMKGGDGQGSCTGDMTLVGVGVLLKMENGKLVVDDVIAEMAEKFTGPVPEKGDVLDKIQGTVLTQPGLLAETFNKISTGDKVDLVLKRQGKEITTGFVKESCAQDQPMILRKKG